MQKLVLIIFSLCFLLVCSCHNSPTKNSKPAEKPVETTSFFPVTDFLLGQLNEIDSMPVTPLKINIIGSKSDSSWQTKKDVRTFSLPFLHPVIDSIFTNNFFSEKSFVDQTINAVTFSYDAKTRLPDSINLNHWDVYIDPQTNKVQRIYLVKQETYNEETITTQLTWKVNDWCSIRSIVEKAGSAPIMTEQIMKWGFDE